MIIIALIIFLNMVVMSAVADESDLPGTFEYSLGNATVTTLAERQQTISKDILIGASDEIIKRYAPDGSVPNAINAFLVDIEGKQVLVDTGLGLKLLENLKAVGLSADDIDVVLITHMHRDHIGGLLRDDSAVFANATLYIARREFEYWKSKGDAARLIADAYAGRFRLFHPEELDAEDPEPLICGITAFAAYGHTPGHTVFLVDGLNKQLLIWGDITHATSVQVPHPEITVTYDVDPSQAIATRRRVFAYVMENKFHYVGGMHISYPGIAYLWQQKKTDMYHIAPADYKYTQKESGVEIFVRSDGYRTETERITEGAAKGQIRRLKETNEHGSWWQITEHSYDNDGYPVRIERNLYFPNKEAPVESEESVYFPQSKKIHYKKKTDRQNRVRYTVFNQRWQVVAYISGEGKLIEEKLADNEKYWEPLLKAESADQARARLAEDARKKAEYEQAEYEQAEQLIENSDPITLFEFPETIKEALPADIDDALPPGIAAFIPTIRKAHLSSQHAIMLLGKQLGPLLKGREMTSVDVRVVDQNGKPVPGAQVTLEQIRLLGDSADIARAQSSGRLSESWRPMSQTQPVNADGNVIFKDVSRFSFFHLARLLFYHGKMPEANMRVRVQADGYDAVVVECCNVDRETLALAKTLVAVLTGFANDPSVELTPELGQAKKQYGSDKLAKTFAVPEENRHDIVKVKIVLKHISRREQPST